MNKVGYSLIIFIFSMFLGIFNVSASTYTPTYNSFDNSYSNNLIDMAISQIPNFLTKDYVIFQNDNGYYLVSGDYDPDYTSAIKFTDSTIIRAYRSGSSYSYNYSTYSESSTFINRNYIVTGNITGNNVVSSQRFSNYEFNYNLKIIGIFILGLIFAIFLTNERSI